MCVAGVYLYFYQTPKLDTISEPSSHNAAGVSVSAILGLEALMLNPRILQLGDMRGNSVMDNILRM